MDDVVLALEISEDRRHTSIVAAAEVDGYLTIDLIAYLDGTNSAVSAVAEMRAERTIAAVIVDPHSHASTLVKPLSDAGIVVTQPSSSDVVCATGEFLDLLAENKLRHTGRVELDAAVRHGTQRRLGGAAAWDRRGAQVDVAPLTAATLACWGLAHAPRQAFFFHFGGGG